jgi:hypothetical protein
LNLEWEEAGLQKQRKKADLFLNKRSFLDWLKYHERKQMGKVLANLSAIPFPIHRDISQTEFTCGLAFCGNSSNAGFANSDSDAHCISSFRNEIYAHMNMINNKFINVNILAA